MNIITRIKQMFQRQPNPEPEESTILVHVPMRASDLFTGDGSIPPGTQVYLDKDEAMAAAMDLKSLEDEILEGMAELDQIMAEIEDEVEEPEDTPHKQD